MNWDRLVDITQLQFERSRMELSQLTEQLSKLEQDRERLRELGETGNSSEKEMNLLRLSGGGLLWGEWLNRSFSNLSIEEARVRAQIEYKMPNVKRTFGRAQVALELQRQTKTSRDSRGKFS